MAVEALGSSTLLSPVVTAPEAQGSTAKIDPAIKELIASLIKTLQEPVVYPIDIEVEQRYPSRGQFNS